MRFSAFTDILERPFEGALDALAGIGLGTVDVRSRIGRKSVDTLEGDAAGRAGEAIRSRGLAVGTVASWGVNTMNGDYDPASIAHRREMRELTAHLSDLARLLGARNVRVYSFTRPEGDVTESHRADNAEFLSELAAVAAERGRVLVIENEPPTLTATCRELGDLMRRAGSDSLKVNWDIVNGWRAGELPWGKGAYDEIAGHVATIHVKGARAGADGSYATMAVPGDDDVPHAELLARLLASGFDGTVTIDPHYGDFAPGDRLGGHDDPVLEVTRRTLAFLEKTVADLGADGTKGA